MNGGMTGDKLLIVDNNEEFLRNVGKLLERDFRICTARNGTQGLQMLREYQPDILLTDLMLPETDGLTMLQRAKDEGIRVRAMVVTWMESPYVWENLHQLGVGYVMIKPCNPAVLVSRLRDLGECDPWEVTAAADPGAGVERILLDLGLNPKHQGFRYLCSCVQLMARHPGIPVTKELYPAVAAELNVNAMQVERSSRTAIEAAWKNGSREAWEKFFPGMDRPSNSVFISRLASKLRTR